MLSGTYIITSSLRRRCTVILRQSESIQQYASRSLNVDNDLKYNEGAQKKSALSTNTKMTING